MTGPEKDRMDVIEAKVDRILTLLDDPDFGVRVTLKDHSRRIRGLEWKFYAVVAGLLGGIVFVMNGVLHG